MVRRGAMASGKVPNCIRCYIRVSTEEQAQEGFSLPVQKERLQDFIRSQWGKNVPIEWYEDEGESAKSLNRTHLRRLRREAKGGDLVLVLKLDRLTRSVRDLYELLQEWEERDILFRSATEPYDTRSSEGKFMIGLLGLLAQWERERIAERVREVMKGILLGADPRPLTKPPFGYRLEDGNYVIVPEEAEVVRTIFDLYIKGKGARAIALYLNGLGERTKEGAQWSDFSVTYVLKNHAYIGKLTWNRVQKNGKRRGSATGDIHEDTIVIDGVHEPIITQDVWEAAQQVRGRRRDMSPRAATSDYPLSGIAYCGKCGGPMSGHPHHRYDKKTGKVIESQTRHYYRCSRRQHYKTCDMKAVRSDMLEAQVLRELSRLAEPHVLRSMAEKLFEHMDAEEHRRRMGELEGRLGKLDRKRAFYDEARAEGDITHEEWREKTADIRREQQELREELERLRRTTPMTVNIEELADQLSGIPDVWAELTGQERKAVLQGLIERIVVHPDGTVAVTPRVFAQTEAAASV